MANWLNWGENGELCGRVANEILQLPPEPLPYFCAPNANDA